jgi:hypothetical protein
LPPALSAPPWPPMNLTRTEANGIAANIKTLR